MSADRLVTTSTHLVRFLRQSANYAKTLEAPPAFVSSLERSAGALERAVSEFLAAPPDESHPREASYLDTLYEQTQHPGGTISRSQLMWALAITRRARALIRRYLGAAEITEPAESIVEGQRWLDEVEQGPDLAKTPRGPVS